MNRLLTLITAFLFAGFTSHLLADNTYSWDDGSLKDSQTWVSDDGFVSITTSGSMGVNSGNPWFNDGDFTIEVGEGCTIEGYSFTGWNPSPDASQFLADDGEVDIQLSSGYLYITVTDVGLQSTTFSLGQYLYHYNLEIVVKGNTPEQSKKFTLSLLDNDEFAQPTESGGTTFYRAWQSTDGLLTSTTTGWWRANSAKTWAYLYPGEFTLTAADGYVITSITISYPMATRGAATLTLDDGTEYALPADDYPASDIVATRLNAKNYKFTISGEADYVAIYKGYLLVTYQQGEPDADAIDVADATVNRRPAVFDLSGRRLDAARRGIVISDGRKVLVP